MLRASFTSLLWSACVRRIIQASKLSGCDFSAAQDSRNAPFRSKSGERERLLLSALPLRLLELEERLRSRREEGLSYPFSLDGGVRLRERRDSGAQFTLLSSPPACSRLRPFRGLDWLLALSDLFLGLRERERLRDDFRGDFGLLRPRRERGGECE